MLKGEEIEKLVEILVKRGVFLYHACQLVDFRSYLTVGGIPSRAYLENLEQPFTTFKTDTSDRHRGVWDKVFFNLSDFGRWFAQNAMNTPNPFGPILFVVQPTVLLEASDVAICLRSAGESGFDREKEALSSIDAVNGLFVHAIEEGFPKSSYIKFGKELQEYYQEPRSRNPEVSCTVESGLLSIKHIKKIIVDPYTFQQKPLLKWVEQFKNNSGEEFPVYERICNYPQRIKMYNELASFLVDKTPSLQDFSQNYNASEDLKEWARQIKTPEWQFKRFADYLSEGTILPILEGQI